MMGAKPSPSWKRRLVGIGIKAGTVYLLLFGILLLLEDSLVFRPAKAEEDWKPPSKHLRLLRDIELSSGDLRVHAWWSPPESWDKTKGAVLYCHGNGGNLSWWGRAIEAWNQYRDEAVLIFDYPGYGKSSGKPSESGCYAAADAEYEWLIEEQRVAAEHILLVGQSLGGAVATHLAVDQKHRALVLISAFSSMSDIAAEKFPIFPGRWFIHNSFDNVERIGRCHRPVFVAHGTADLTVPFHHAEKVFAAACEPKKLYVLHGFGHHVPLDAGFFRALQEFLEQAEGRN